MKELNQIVLQKGLFTSIKGQLCLTKGTWTTQKDRQRLNPPPPPPNQKLFLISFVCIKKNNFFSKKGTFNKAYNPGMLYLSKIGPDVIESSFAHLTDCNYSSNLQYLHVNEYILPCPVMVMDY